MSRTPSILIVEDEYGLAELLRDMLTELGYDVRLRDQRPAGARRVAGRDKFTWS